MQIEASLTFIDHDGRTRSVAVDARYFSIGRTPENNLQIADSNLSRQHALIERFDSFLQITDCGSQNGTTVNGAPISGAVELRHDDVITLGGAIDLQVSLRAAAPAPIVTPTTTTAASSSTHHASVTVSSPVSAPAPWWLSISVLAALGAALVFILGAAITLFIVSRPERSAPEQNDTEEETVVADTNTATTNEAAAADTTSTIASNSVAAVDNVSQNSAGLERVEAAAEQVMRRVSTDSKDYSFSEKAVRDVAQKIELYRAAPTPVRDALGALQKDGSSIAAAARNEGIAQPYLVLYAALAVADGGRTERDAALVARRILPDLIALRTTLGDDQDSSLLVIAAYPEGVGTKKSHPLLGRMRRVIREPVTQRNVWYLHEHGGLNAEAYDLVIRFLALGVIAQNPAEFGVNTQPLAF